MYNSINYRELREHPLFNASNHHLLMDGYLADDVGSTKNFSLRWFNNMLHLLVPEHATTELFALSYIVYNSFNRISTEMKRINITNYTQFNKNNIYNSDIKQIANSLYRKKIVPDSDIIYN